ncbi:dienelactone hydrolase family protein [Hyphococcus sp. DH-69]|uniref:dienelactone hydrolase family protein n=1 Tax=Hyphococcus formosus TaxID=3143534 RepID=UPI00398B3115
MTVSTRTHSYEINGKQYKAYIASHGKAAPTVILCHAWAGRTHIENAKADAFAALGYTAIAIDLFGSDVVGSSTDECQALITPFMEDRGKLRDLLLANIDEMKKLDDVDASNVAVAGYCFGGLCAMDAARANADVKGVISFHGLFAAPDKTADEIKPKMLVLHGWDDPMVPPTDVVALGEELTKANADWQLHAYGGTMHAFTNPEANDPDFGTVYDADADRRSWQSTIEFLEELFG